MATTLFFTDTSLQLTSISIDATLSETHEKGAEITESPVERGANIADHVRPKPEVCTLEGVITDYPLDGSGHVPGRAAEIYADLEELENNGTVLDVQTSIKGYPSMVLENLRTVQTKDTSGAITFTALLRQIRIAESQFVKLSKTSEPSTKPKISSGSKQGEPATEAEKKKSILLKFIDGPKDTASLQGAVKALVGAK